MAECPEIVGGKPARAAKRFGALFVVCHLAPVEKADPECGRAIGSCARCQKPTLARRYRKTRFCTASPLMISKSLLKAFCGAGVTRYAQTGYDRAASFSLK